MIINDLIPAVVGKLRGRTDKNSFLPYYIAQTLIDLTQNYEFEELKITGPLTNFVEDISSYPIRGYDLLGINGNPFIQSVNDRITFLRSWFVYFDTGGVVTPGISTGMVMKSRDLRVVEPTSKIQGIPSIYCLKGSYDNYGQILVGAMPDNPYPTQLTYQREHPFNLSYEQVLLSAGSVSLSNLVGASKIWLPKDWVEIVILATAEKACYDISMNDIGMQYHQQLYGYKDKKGNDIPGIITVRQSQQERQSGFNERAMKPIVRRYT